MSVGSRSCSPNPARAAGNSPPAADYYVTRPNTCNYAEEKVEAYFHRDEVEKAFRVMKVLNDSGPLCFRLSDTLVAYLAVVNHFTYLFGLSHAGHCYRLAGSRAWRRK